MSCLFIGVVTLMLLLVILYVGFRILTTTNKFDMMMETTMKQSVAGIFLTTTYALIFICAGAFTNEYYVGHRYRLYIYIYIYMYMYIYMYICVPVRVIHEY